MRMPSTQLRMSSIRLRLPSMKLRLPFSGRRQFSRPVIPTDKDLKREAIACPNPTTVFQPWAVNAFIPGLEDEPNPIEYTMNHPKAHKLSIVDIDIKDTRMAIFVDGVLRGLTRDFELNKTMDCGENLRTCLNEGFSAGVVIVPPGNHAVRIEWAGKGWFCVLIILR